jgi:hypothetical protein
LAVLNFLILKVYSLFIVGDRVLRQAARNPQNRQRVKRHYEIDIQEDLDIKIVVGLNPQVDKVKVHQKVRELKYKVDIITYDEILERLIREHDHIYGRHDDLTGYSFHFIVRFRSLPARRKKYFLDVRQNIDSNRVSLYLDEHDRIRFMAIDNTGRRYEVEIDTEEVKLLNEWIYLVCEFGGDNSGFAMSISFNGFEVDKRLKDTAVNLPISLTNATIGCSVDQKEFGRFDLGETIIYTHKLSFRDKLQLLGYIIRKYGESVDKVDYYWEYDGSKFMYMKENGNWIQEKDEHKPILRKTKGVIK